MSIGTKLKNTMYIKMKIVQNQHSILNDLTKFLAEMAGFEPARGYPQTVFKSF